MPCPFFKSGRCTSPVLGSLSTEDLYERGKCDGEGYKSCPYYRDAIKMADSGISFDKRPDPLLNIVDKPPKESCHLMKVVRAERGYAAYCIALDRYLTRFEIHLCEQDYQRCPFRKIALTA